MGIQNYNIDNDIKRSDTVIGTDSSTGRTSNFTIGGITDFVTQYQNYGLDDTFTVLSDDEIIPVPMSSNIELVRLVSNRNDARRTLGFSDKTTISLGEDFDSIYAEAIADDGAGLIIKSASSGGKIYRTILSKSSSDRTITVDSIDDAELLEFSDTLDNTLVIFQDDGVFFTGEVNFSNAMITGLDTSSLGIDVNWGSITGDQNDVNISGFNNDAGFITAGEVPDGTWDGITGKPDTFPPSAHQHTLADITDSGALAGQDTVNLETQVTGVLDSSNLPDISISNIYADGSTTLAAWITANPTESLELGDTVITTTDGTYVYTGNGGAPALATDFELLTIPQSNTSVIDGQELAQAKSTLGVPDTFAPTDADNTATYLSTPATKTIGGDLLIQTTGNDTASIETRTPNSSPGFTVGTKDFVGHSSAGDNLEYGRIRVQIGTESTDNTNGTSRGVVDVQQIYNGSFRTGVSLDREGNTVINNLKTTGNQVEVQRTGATSGIRIIADDDRTGVLQFRNSTLLEAAIRHNNDTGVLDIFKNSSSAIAISDTGITFDRPLTGDGSGLTNIPGTVPPTRGDALPDAGTFGQRFYVDADYAPDPILTQITTSGGTDLILDGFVPASGGNLVGLDFRVTLGDDGRAANVDSIGNLIGALPMNLRIGDTTFTVTATNPSGPGAFGNTATTTTGITAGDFSAFNYLIGENVFISTAQPAITQGWYAFSDQWDSISN